MVGLGDTFPLLRLKVNYILTISEFNNIIFVHKEKIERLKKLFSNDFPLNYQRVLRVNKVEF